MAASLKLKTCYHTRSASLPCSLHPLINRFEEHLCRLKTSEAASSSSSSSSSSVTQKLSDLNDLYECVSDLLILPQAQQALAQECHAHKWVDDALDGSLKLLDVCDTNKDLFMQTKECLQELQSSLRRKSGKSALANDLGQYINSRKKVKKAIQKSLLDLKSMESKHSFSPLDRDPVAMVNMLREVRTATVAVFQLLLVIMSGTTVRSRANGWSLVSKLVLPNRVSSKKEAVDIGEFENVDATLYPIICQKKSKSIDLIQVENLQDELGKLELSIQDMEEGLEVLFRNLIKTRVNLLNILSH
ncbi:uncharacterized protein LOC131155064 [Malania oleifera]|uniref:uncharacterized protein LOC131155064 n=1 Tax=Malania oleifera TaxID=397392 RepID=UPI0025AE8B39|nr:uncharacterized protein LOC131155064 [Malania oleifera]